MVPVVYARRRAVDLAAGGGDRGGVGDLQPAADLVLAGGAVLPDARVARELVAAGVRVRTGCADAAGAGGVGDRVRVGARDALLRGAGRCAGGGLVAVGASVAAAGSGRRCGRRSVRPRADPARDQPARDGARQLDLAARRSGGGSARSSPSSSAGSTGRRTRVFEPVAIAVVVMVVGAVVRDGRRGPSAGVRSSPAGSRSRGSCSACCSSPSGSTTC